MGKLRDGLDALMQAPIFIDDTPASRLPSCAPKRGGCGNAKGGSTCWSSTIFSSCRLRPPAGAATKTAPRNLGHLARPQGHCQGTRRAAGRALAVKPAPETRSKDDEPELERICANRAPLNKMPMWSCSCSSSTTTTDPDLENKAKLIIGSSVMAPPTCATGVFQGLYPL